MATIRSTTRSSREAQRALLELARNHLSASQLIVGLLGTAAHTVENAVYILLFLAFLLPGARAPSPRKYLRGRRGARPRLGWARRK